MAQIKSPNVKYREIYEAINAIGPYRYFVTFTFQYRTSDREGRRHMSTILKRLQRALFGNQWRQGTALAGVVVLEHACIQPGNRGVADSCHFHCLIKDHPRFSREFRPGFRQIRSAAKRVTSGLKHSNGRTLTGRTGIRVKFARDDGLGSYVSKEASRRDWDMSDRFFPIGFDGIGSDDVG